MYLPFWNTKRVCHSRYSFYGYMSPHDYKLRVWKLSAEDLLTVSTTHSNFVKVFEKFAVGLMNSLGLTCCHTDDLFTFPLDFGYDVKPLFDRQGKYESFIIFRYLVCPNLNVPSMFQHVTIFE